MRSRACIIAALTLFTLATSSPAKVEMGLTLGWQGPYRAGRWTPLYITATDSSPRQVILELYAVTDQNYAMKVRQSFAIGPTPVTRAVYIPLTYSLDQASVTLLDADSLRRVATMDLTDTFASLVDVNQMFVGIAGGESTTRLLQGQFNQDNIRTGSLPQSYLPAVPVGYDALNLFVLNQPNFNKLEADQQRAIVQWVRGGGMLVVIPGADPLPETGPLIETLPVKLGTNRTYELSPKELKSAGLPERFKSLKGREVTAVADGAIAQRVFIDGNIKAYRHWVGFGQVMVIPADVSPLMFQSPKESRAFWTSVLADMVAVPQENDSNNQQYRGWQDDPRQARATAQALDWMSDVPGAGAFGFSYLAMALIAMMFVVGPVDWFVLKWTGRQPWTWVTTTGWIALVTLAALYTGHMFKSGELYFRTLTVMDEADGMRVAQTSLAGIYSPRTHEYDFEFEPESWWRPASNSNYYRGQEGLQREIDCHQDYRGNRPEPMLINVWNLRYLHGQDTTPTGAVITAKLSRRGDALDGSVTNQAPFTLRDVIIRTGDGPLRLKGTLAPGATATVSGTINRHDNALASTMPSRDNNWRGYQEELSTTQPTLPIAGDIAVTRTDRIESILRDRRDVACVYAQFEENKPLAMKLDEPEARQTHLGMIRSLVTLESK